MPGPRVKQGARITLRTVEKDDLTFLHRGWTNEEIRYPVGASLWNREQLEDAYEEDFGGGEQFLICLDSDDAVPGTPDEDTVSRIGWINIIDNDMRRPEVGFWLIPDAQGNGYAREAVSVALDYVFNVYDHPAVGAETFEFNEASRRLLESLGFTREGQIRSDWFRGDQYHDVLQYGLLRDEWSD